MIRQLKEIANMDEDNDRDSVEMDTIGYEVSGINDGTIYENEDIEQVRTIL